VITLSLLILIAIVALALIAFMFALIPVAIICFFLALGYFVLSSLFPGWFW
jgi:hypothetical protein